jgi:hypothetical protein
MATKKKECCDVEVNEKELTAKEKVVAAVENLLKTKKVMDLEERRERFGMAADCDMIVVNRLTAVVVDNPLPDDDMAILVTNTEKIIDLVLGGIGKRFVEESKGVKFFEEE